MFGSLHSISPQQILTNTDSIVAQDRRLTLQLLEHLHEIDRRKLYLERGFASTFDYCTKHLRLFEPSAARRIRTARCVARYPQLYPLLEAGELNLTVVSMVSKYLKPGNVDEIVKRIMGKSKREVERIIAEYEPRAALPLDRVRMVVVPTAPASPAVPALPTAIASSDAPTAIAADHTLTPGNPAAATLASRQVTVTGDSEKSPSADDANRVVANAPQGQASGSAATKFVTEGVQFERLARVEFTAHEDLMAKLEQIRSLASHRLPSNASLEQLISFMADYFIEREDPARRHERREARASKQEKTVAPVASNRPRHVPAHVHDEVFARDKQCTYVSPDGNRCGSRHVLQVDHIKPVARRGASTIDNLRLLCAYHNRLESERLMGKRGRRDVIREARAAYS